MKKLFVWAMLATLLMAGSAMAQSLTGTLDARTLLVQPNATFSPVVGPGGALLSGPSTTNNDDSCDISVSPAATLLLPHFEVEWAQADRSRALNTIFTITNTTRFSQIAHITIWTDWSFPTIDFNVYLTGYDVAGISLYDIIANGRILPPPPHLGSGYRISPRGPLSVNDSTSTGVGILANPNHLPAAYAGGNVDCGSLPGNIPGSLLADLRAALTDGTYPGCPGRVGSRHTNAEGYVTIDVANVCSQSLPTDPSYYFGEILYDNVLIGDYQRINPRSDSGNYAGGNPLVHIKAIPEGGPFVLSYPGVAPAGPPGGGTAVLLGAGLPAGPARGVPTNFDWTFYDRYTVGLPRRDFDRRQPLPGLFAARYIESAAGSGGFVTEMAIWREGVLDGATTIACPRVGGFDVLSLNGTIPVTEIVRFDEQENPSLSEGCQISPCPGATDVFAPETASTPTSDTSLFPPDFGGTTDGGGWMYMNLNNGGASAYSDFPPNGPGRTESQNWVTIRMTAEGGRYGVDFDAAFLGNGCSNNPGGSTSTSNPIQPSPNLTPALPSIVAPCVDALLGCVAP